MASAGIFIEHPLIGVGLGKFWAVLSGSSPFPKRRKKSKIRIIFWFDFLSSLGLIGGLLSVAWLLRLGWEITKPTTESHQADEDEMTVKSAAAIVLVGMLLNIAANINFSLPLADVLALLIRPILYLLAILLGTIAASMRSPQKWSLDNRPIPWIFYCEVTGLGLFLLHNLIDFSWFEAGIMGDIHGVDRLGIGGERSRSKATPFQVVGNRRCDHRNAGVDIGSWFFCVPDHRSRTTCRGGRRLDRHCAGAPV